MNEPLLKERRQKDHPGEIDCYCPYKIDNGNVTVITGMAYISANEPYDGEYWFEDGKLKIEMKERNRS